MSKKTVIALIILALFVVGCSQGQKVIKPAPEDSAQSTTQVATETATDPSLTEVTADIEEVDSIGHDLDDTALDDLEKELTDLDW